MARHTYTPGDGKAGWGVIALVAAIALAAPAAAEPDIPLDKEPENLTLISLGPIGARVKTDQRVETCADSQSSQGTVKYIYKNSPAEGKLELEDEIVGVNGQPFNKDFSRRMGAAIDWSEGNTGRLELDIRRQGKPLKLAFAVPKIGSYSPTYPVQCKKSAIVLEAACDWLVRNQNKDGGLGDSLECTAVGGLAFLGSGNPKYQEPIARIVKLILAHFKPESEWPYGVKKFGPSGYWPVHGLETWRLNYAAIFLSEYYLATGDASVLPTMEKLNRNIAFRQFHYLPENVKKAFAAKNNPLPPYWFSHQFPPDGYGNLGVNVANALLAWQLLSECGVAVDRDNFEKTRDYVQVAGPTGEMPYASAPNQRGGDGDAFGRTGVLAVVYSLCRDRAEHSGKIAGALRRLQKDNYFTSHASSDLGKAWGTLGMAALDPALFREAMDAHKYDYLLVRLSDGSFAANPAVHPQNAGNGDFQFGRVWTTAFNALIFTLARGKLRIAGAERKRTSGWSAAPQAASWPAPSKPKPAADAGGTAGADGTVRTEAKPPAPQRKPACAEALKEWDGRLKAAVASRLQAGTRPTFVFSAVGGPAEIVSLDAKGEMKLNAAGSALFLSWARLTLDDKRALASGLAAGGEPGDVALAAFYSLAAGDEKAAEPHLRRLGEKERAALDAAFQ
jgi:hypothetical protein